MKENDIAIGHLAVLVEHFSLARHNEMLDALSWLINDRARLGTEGEKARLAAQAAASLLKGMGASQLAHGSREWLETREALLEKLEGIR